MRAEQPRLDELLAAAPDLAAYTHALEALRSRRRTTAPPELLGEVESLTDTFYVTYKTLVSSEMRFASPRDSQGDAHPLTTATFHALMRQPDRTLRQATYEAYGDGFGALSQTCANLLAGAFNGQSTLATARSYRSALDAALDATGLLRTGDEPGVFATLLETCQRHVPLWHRYYDLRRRALGLETLRPWDMDVSLAVDAPQVSYDEARATILAAVAPLGDDYVAVLRRGLYEERWVDWATNAGKLAGAEQSGCWGTHPFVLLSWDASVISMSALAHELGHAMHMYSTWRDQLPVYDDVVDYLSETASTFHQALLRAHLLRTSSDPALRRAVLSEALTYYERYLLIMPLLARFEMEGHQRSEQGQSLGVRWLSARMLELLRAAYGPASRSTIQTRRAWGCCGRRCRISFSTFTPTSIRWGWRRPICWRMPCCARVSQRRRAIVVSSASGHLSTRSMRWPRRASISPRRAAGARFRHAGGPARELEAAIEAG